MLFEIKSEIAKYELIWSKLFASSILNKNKSIKANFNSKIFLIDKKNQSSGRISK